MGTLKERIENEMDEKAKKYGIMGTENCTVTMELTDAEKEELESLDLSKNYYWEIEDDKLIVTYTES